MTEKNSSRGRAGLRATLAVLSLLLAGLPAPVFAQETSETDERIEALEKQLEEIKARLAEGEGDDVEERLEAIEQALAELKADLASGEAPAAPASPSGTTADSQTGKKEPLPAGVQGAPNPMQDDRRFLTGQDLLDASFPNSVPIPGSEVRFKIDGYAKLSFIQDFDYVGDRFEFELATIPVEGTPEAALDGRTTVHAKETRVGIDFRSKAHSKKSGREFPLQAVVEIDFFDDREDFSLQPRLRHAYGVVGRILAGRSWTVSTDLQALAGTLDFAGGDALYGDRVAQVRWQDRAGEHMTWAIGLEDPKSNIGNPEDLDGEERPSLPNLGWRMRWAGAQGSHLQVGGDVFQLDWQGGDTGPSDKEIGFGLNLTGRLLVGRRNNNAITGGASIGNGSAHRVVTLEGDGNDAVITPAGLDLMSHWQAYIGYSHYWTESLNSTISTHWTELDNSRFQPDTAIHRAGSAHLNLVWFPYKLASTGVEIMWGERVNKDGLSGDAWRFMWIAKYKFN